MAVSTCLFRLEWENGNMVEFGEKDEGEASYSTVYKGEENESWADWDSIALLMQNAVARKIAAVGDVMKAP